MTNTMTIHIPMQIDGRMTPNGRAHWAVRKRLREDMQAVTDMAMREAVTPNDPVACFQAAPWPLTLDYEIRHGKGRRKLDDDNAIAAMKPIRDQIARYLGIDDRNMRTGAMTQTRDTTGKGEIVVTIRAAEAEEDAA